MADSDPDASARFLESSRFWIQRVLVPIVVCIGLGGNIVTVKVLTRRRMRCTTTIYLTALAVADLLYLLFVLLLSFQHYPNIHHRKYELYWRFYGISHWICDAASSTSVWLTVSFTLERYLVVCHPIKGKVLCTESRAKNIIALVSVLCLLTTLSTTFEYELSPNEECLEYSNGTFGFNASTSLEKNDQMPPENLTTYDHNVFPSDESHTKEVDMFSDDTNVFNNVFNNRSSAMGSTQEEIGTGRATSETNRTQAKSYAQVDVSFASQKCECGKNDTAAHNATKKDCGLSSDWVFFNGTCCRVNYTIEPTRLGKNETYQTVFYWYSAIMFGLLPLVLIATFNSFLVRAVYKSQVQRKEMTNSQENATQNQENRITLLLISVVVLFLICQTPTASYLIYDAFDGIRDQHTENIKKALGNIFNFLLTLNAACNFILYCVLSDRYRKTFKMLFCERKLNRLDTMSISRSRLSQRFNPNANGFKRSKTEYGRTPRNLETQSLTSIPRSKSLLSRQPGKTKSDDLLV